MFVALYPALHLLFLLSLALFIVDKCMYGHRALWASCNMHINGGCEGFLDFGSFSARLLVVFATTHIHNACVGF